MVVNGRDGSVCVCVCTQPNGWTDGRTVYVWIYLNAFRRIPIVERWIEILQNIYIYGNYIGHKLA